MSRRRGRRRRERDREAPSGVNIDSVARRGFEPLTSSLKGKRPGPLGDRAAPQGYGRGTDDAALPVALRLVHRLIGVLDERIGADAWIVALRDSDRGADVQRLTREIERGR